MCCKSFRIQLLFISCSIVSKLVCSSHFEYWYKSLTVIVIFKTVRRVKQLQNETKMGVWICWSECFFNCLLQWNAIVMVMAKYDEQVIWTPAYCIVFDRLSHTVISSFCELDWTWQSAYKATRHRVSQPGNLITISSMVDNRNVCCMTNWNRFTFMQAQFLVILRFTKLHHTLISGANCTYSVYCLVQDLRFVHS